MTKYGALAIWAIAMPLLSGCAAPSCQPGSGEPMLVFDLFFGRSVSGRGEVTEKEWGDFLDKVITPTLPAGYTVLDGRGAWMSPKSRTTISENTKILIVAMPDVPASRTAIEQIRSLWQRQYHQYVVGMTIERACGLFSP